MLEVIVLFFLAGVSFIFMLYAIFMLLVKKKEIDWKANGDERIRKMMENMRQRQDSLRQEYNKMDEYNRTIFPLGN